MAAVATSTPVVKTPTTTPAVPAKKWHGAFKETINAPIDKAWAIAGNFCALDKWVKTLERCDKIEGEYQQPGCVRYLLDSTALGADGKKFSSKDKLLSIDGKNHSISYIMLDNNFGLDGFVSNLKLHDLGDGKTLVDYSFDVNPMENQSEEGLAAFVTASQKQSYKILEDLVQAQAN